MDCFETSVGQEKILRFRIWEDGEVFIEDVHGTKYITDMCELYECIAKLDNAFKFIAEQNSGPVEEYAKG